ncbi:MAG: hypothetical protein N2689_14780 [Verrucomicrobiae bacterium]|nr:hypothetical protein [Verrucomicrobiae bacterium]
MKADAMKWHLANLGLSIAAAATRIVAGDEPHVAVYPPLPNNTYQSRHYEVIVEQGGRQFLSYVYQSDNHGDLDAYHLEKMTAANHFTSFSFQGRVMVHIHLLGGATAATAVVRPLSSGLRATANGNQITLALEKPGQFYVEVPGKAKHPLFIFADPPEREVPSAQAHGVLYFGPGLHDLGKAGAELTSDTTVYLAGGAYVKGLFKARPGVKVAFRGRGILSGIAFPHYTNDWSHHLIDVPPSARGELTVEGITLTDSPKACLESAVKTRVENVKFFSWHQNTDGVFVGNGSTVKRCFFKVNDDVIKLYSSRMTVTDSVVWMQPTGAAVQLSWNLRQPVTDACVSGMDIIRFDRHEMPGRYKFINNAVVASRNFCGGRTGPGVVIENLRFEEPPLQLFGMKIKQGGKYNEGRGGIHGVTFRNWTMPSAPRMKSLIDGNGTETGAIENLVFENIMIGPTKLTAANADEFITRTNKTANFTYR